jgi:uncharacterized membrane protein
MTRRTGASSLRYAVSPLTSPSVESISRAFVRLHPTTVALAAGWPLASHAAALAGRVDLMPWITATVVAGMALLLALAVGRPALWVGAVVAAVMAFALASLMPAATMFVPPVAIPIALATLFAMTLRRGEEPMIARFARRERGGTLEPDLAAYARRLTLVWIGLFVAMGTIAAALAITAPLAIWSLFVNVVAYIAVLGLLVGEHAYRRVRFGHYRHAALTEFLRAVATGFPPADR